LCAAETTESILEDKMTPSRHVRRALYTLIGAIILFVNARPVHAETYLSGTYDCTTVEIGGRTSKCTAPSLELKSDGSYKILSERGTYEIVKGRWLVLSSTKNHGAARLDGSREIVFEFVSRGKRSRIVYRRKYQIPPGWVAS
jgi:hypothetical protein